MEAIERSGRDMRVEVVTALVDAVDGAVVSALVSNGDGPRELGQGHADDVIDVLAPIDERTIRV